MCAGGLAVLAFTISYHNSDFTARVTLIPREISTAFVAGLEGEAYRPRQLTSATLISLMESPELLRRVSDKVIPAIPESAFKDQIRAEPVTNTELVALEVAGKDRARLVETANLYAEEAVRLSKELQLAESARMNSFCQEKLSAMDKELEDLNQELLKFQDQAGLSDPNAQRQSYIQQLGEMNSKADNLRIEAGMVDLQAAAIQNELAQQNPIAQRLQSARNKLTDLLTRLTEAHPNVQSQRKEIAELERQLANVNPTSLSAAGFSENSVLSTLYMRLVELRTRKATIQKELEELDHLKQSLQTKVTGVSEMSLHYANLKARLEGLQQSRSLLASRQREAQLYEDSAQGSYRVFTPATLKDVDGSLRWIVAARAGVVGLVLGALVVGLAITMADLAGGRLKTVPDLERITGLPVLATLGDLNKMTTAEKEAWAFRTWTALSGQLNSSPNQGMVCGFISSTDGEGRSTWIKLLANAARHRGLRVLTVSASPTGSASDPEMETVQPPDRTGNNQHSERNASPGERPLQTETLTPQALATPGDAARALSGPGSLPASHLRLAGWAWDPERRTQWQKAVAYWHAMDNLALFIELPPASMPEAVLLAERLPHLIWLADSGKPRSRSTREQVQTLRHAKCRLIGAVLNHEPKPVFEL